MNQPRVLLWGGLLFVLWLNFNAWMKDYAPRPAAPQNWPKSWPEIVPPIRSKTCSHDRRSPV